MFAIDKSSDGKWEEKYCCYLSLQKKKKKDKSIKKLYEILVYKH